MRERASRTPRGAPCYAVASWRGKWHLGHADRKFWPKQRGFDHQYGPLIGEIDYFTHRQQGVLDWYRNNRRLEEPGYSTDLIGNEAVRLITKHDPKIPLYLYLTFNAPHTPYQAPQAYLDRYKHIADPSRRAYAAMVTAMDAQVGRVVAALDKRGMRKNTLIVFQSDNGGTSNPMFAGEGDVSKIKIPVDNGPLRDGKGSLYEGGTRVVAFANWPGHIKPGNVDGMMHVVDMYPTLAALAGASLDGGKPLDGMDMWRTISRIAPSPRNEIIYNLEPFRAGVRDGDWKLVWRTPLVHAHLLRHTGITQLVQEGMEEPAVRKFVGHRSPDSLAPYLHLCDEFVEREFEQAQAALSPLAWLHFSPLGGEQ